MSSTFFKVVEPGFFIFCFPLVMKVIIINKYIELLFLNHLIPQLRSVFVLSLGVIFFCYCACVWSFSLVDFLISSSNIPMPGKLATRFVLLKNKNS